nr:hypothetical protein [Tanacetum cinerariifolium]
MDKIICDLNKTLDLFQRPPQNCPKCGNPVDGQYCQGCAHLRKKFKEDLFTYCIENGIFQDFQDTSEPSNNNTNIVNALQESFVVNQDPDKNSSQSLPQINNHCCYGCGDSLDDIFCHQCTCELCRKGISSSDDQSFSNEDILKEIYLNPLFDEEIISMKIDPHHFNVVSDLIESMLNQDSSIISSSSKIDSLIDEFSEIRLYERLLYDNSSPGPPEEFVSENSDVAIKSFSPSPILVKDSDSLMEEIDLSFTPDEKDILILEELLSNNSLSLPKNESFHFDIHSSSRPPAKPPNGNSGILNVKVMGDISEHNVLMLTQPTLSPNQEKYPNFLSHQGHEASQPSTECPMMIYRRNTSILDVPFLHFYPP